MAFISATTFAQMGPGPDAQYIKDNYTKYEYQVPMRMVKNCSHRFMYRRIRPKSTPS